MKNPVDTRQYKLTQPKLTQFKLVLTLSLTLVEKRWCATRCMPRVMLGRRTAAVVAHRLSAMRLVILLLSWINVRWSKKGTTQSRGPPGALIVTVQDPNNTTQCLQLFNSQNSRLLLLIAEVVVEEMLSTQLGGILWSNDIDRRSVAILQSHKLSSSTCTYFFWR